MYGWVSVCVCVCVGGLMCVWGGGGCTAEKFKIRSRVMKYLL